MDGCKTPQYISATNFNAFNYTLSDTGRKWLKMIADSDAGVSFEDLMNPEISESIMGVARFLDKATMSGFVEKVSNSEGKYQMIPEIRDYARSKLKGYRFV